MTSGKFQRYPPKQEKQMSAVFVFQGLKLSVPVKTEEDVVLHIKEENLRDGYSRETRSETDRERKESGEKKGGRQTDGEEHSTGDSSKEVRKAEYLQQFRGLVQDSQTSSNCFIASSSVNGVSKYLE